MTRVATKPLDPAATASANAAVGKAYPTPPSPGDPAYADFQKAWMDAYVENGGGYTDQSPDAAADTAKQAQQAPVANSSSAPGTTQACFGPKDAAFKPPETPCSCTLSELKVICSHGRSASSGLLQIVVDEAGKGDELTVAPASSGDCVSKLVIRTSNMTGAGAPESKGPATFKRDLAGPSAVQIGSWGWWKATPSRGSVEATTCGGNPEMIRVEHFPTGESKLQLNLTNLVEGFTGGFRKLPVDLRLFTQKGTPRKIRRSGEAKAEDFTLDGLKKRMNNTKSAGFEGEIIWKLASAWKEDTTNHLVYCEIVSILGADPLFEAKFSILVYGIPIPSTVRKYIDVAAGIYLNVNGKVTLDGQIAGRRYPMPTDRWDWQDVRGNLGGELKFELALELCAFSPSVLQAKGGGSVSASAKGTVRNEFGPKIWVGYQVNAGKLAAAVTFKTMWGLVEYEREWQIFDGWSDEDDMEVADFS